MLVRIANFFAITRAMMGSNGARDQEIEAFESGGWEDATASCINP